uniref:Uncharacterized protein n=1 Tax=Ciona intestinalis TaxID=7719 RepID=H2XXL1_CIOIN
MELCPGCETELDPVVTPSGWIRRCIKCNINDLPMKQNYQ